MSGAAGRVVDDASGAVVGGVSAGGAGGGVVGGASGAHGGRVVLVVVWLGMLVVVLCGGYGCWC